MDLTFKELISDLSAQDTHWRELAQKSQDYYDHLQITSERQAQLFDCEQLDLVGNLIQPTVNAVLGNEEQQRVDWLVLADDEPSKEVAEGLNAKLNEAMRLSNANHAASEAYKAEIIKGVGWVYVERNPDPFDTKDYLIHQLPVSEVFWDMRSRHADMSDCRWWSRRKFMDVDEALKFFPDEKKLIKNLSEEWPTENFEIGDEAAQVWHAYRSNEYAQAASTSNSIEHLYKTESGRRRIAVYEVYYRTYENVEVVRYSDGRKEEKVTKTDKDSKRRKLMQDIAVTVGSAKRCSGQTVKMMRKWFIGPHEVADEPSPHPHNYYPAVPFWGYRQDNTNTPYGLVRGMIDPQDAFNEVGFRIMHILDHKRILKEEDASNMKDSEIVHEMNRKDGVVNVKPGRLGHILIEQDWNELQALRGEREVFQQQIRDFSGIYNSHVAQRSGVGINAAAEADSTPISEINANYEFGRKMLGELVLAFIVDDIGKAQVKVDIKEGSKTKKTVCLNGEPNEHGMNNDIAMARKQVALAHVSSSAGLMSQNNEKYAEMYTTSAGDPVLQRLLMKLFIQTSNTPNADKIIEEWEETTGANVSPEEQAQQAQQQAQMQQQAMQLETAKAESEIAKNQSAAESNQASAGYRQAEAAKTIVETKLLMQQERETQKEINDIEMRKATLAAFKEQQLQTT